MRLLARPIEEVVRDDEPRGRADETDAVAGGIDNAARDDRIIPVAAGNGIVAGVEPAADDVHIPAPALGRAAPVHAVPAARDLHVANLHVVADLEIRDVKITGG